MKRLIRLMVVLSLLIFTVAAAAADMDKGEEKKLLKAARNELNNMEWKIKLSPIGNTNDKGYEDTLSFINSIFSSEKLESESFPGSNYTVSLKGEDVIVWETMQTSESAGVAFWRGELENNIMRGVLSVRSDEKTYMDFSFYNIERKELVAKPPKADEMKKELMPELAKPEEVKQETTAKMQEEDVEEKEEEESALPKKKHWWQ